MKKISAQDPLARSADLPAQNLDRLRALFPQAFTEGKVDFTVLRELLGDQVEEGEERYGLHWHGKARARRLALTPTTGTLRPVPGESVDWDTTRNLVIEGDNLEVLKLLQKSYAGKVKLIYIDPPYNTGNDFVYPDDYRDNLANYLRMTGQTDQAGAHTSSHADTGGRFHTAWLSMMYPRLILAHQLLSPSGILFVTVDDVETASTRMMLNEVFGEENFIAHIAWQKRYVSNATAKHVSSMHDHIWVFAKNEPSSSFALLPRTEEQLEAYDNPDDDPRGPWRAQDLSASKPYSAGRFVIQGPDGQVFSPPPGRYWRCNEETYQRWLQDGRITFGRSGTGRPMLKAFLAEAQEGVTPNTWWDHKFAGHNKEATLELKDLFDGSAPFDTPKPVRLVERVLQLAADPEALVLDFFAGSGTTGQAVLAQNVRDGGQRRFILVQLPEKVDSEQRSGRNAHALQLPTISAIARERLRRVGRKLKEESPLFTGDLGFRAYTLDSSNLVPWDPNPPDLQTTLFDHVENVKPDRTDQDLLTEVLLKLGMDLSVPCQTRVLAGHPVQSLGGGQLMACLSRRIGRADVIPLARGIIEWHRSLARGGSTATLLFRDSAFEDDVARQNLVATLEQAGLTQVRSV